MKMLELKAKQRKNDKYHSYKGTVGKVADNILKREFYANNPYSTGSRHSSLSYRWQRSAN